MLPFTGNLCAVKEEKAYIYVQELIIAIENVVVVDERSEMKNLFFYHSLCIMHHIEWCFYPL